MASVPLQPPAKFNFSNPDEWPKWRRRFEQFRIASGMAGESEERQISTLLYCLGEEAEDVLTSTNISEADRGRYAQVLGKMDEYFKIRKNVIFERARFNRRTQRQGETAEEFITSLYSLAADCQYGNLRDEMIRDRLVVGILDTSLSERLQMNADLTLEKAKQIVRQREAVQKQQTILHRGEQPSETMVSYLKGDKRSSSRKSSTPPQRQQSQHSQKCTRCGKGPHSRGACPAKEAICHKCKKKGHYSAQCFSKGVAEVSSQPTSNLDITYLNTIGSGSHASWKATIKVNNQMMTFKLDTGAEVTALTEPAFLQLRDVPLQAPTKALHGPDRKPLKVLGQVTLTFSSKEKTCIHNAFVVRDLEQNLLGLPAIQDLNLLAKVAEVRPGPDDLGDVTAQFPALFSGLGTLKGEFHIRLKPDATPFALHTPRNVPLPLRMKVKEELARMESMGVISKIDVPTPWCAGMVVVPKKDGTVRICVDLKPLNTAVLREPHPLPKVDDTLAQLSGAKVFSKLDANSGFWQIPIEEKSRHLTTFITPFGRFCFNKMPFGISSAPEHFQRRMNEILDNLPGVLCLMDDIIIHGKNQQEHKERLLATLQRLQAAGVTLNQEKCQFGKSTLNFLGHIISADGISPDPNKVKAVANMTTPTNTTELRRFLGMVRPFSRHQAFCRCLFIWSWCRTAPENRRR